jgi:Alpha/beta hydrolase domain
VEDKSGAAGYSTTTAVAGPEVVAVRMKHTMRAGRFSIAMVWLGLVFAPSVALAQVTTIEITSREPIANSQAFGKAGPYELIRGRIHGEIDPKDRRNQIIQDIELAPRNKDGKVEYVATFALAKPVDVARASGTLVYTVVNRGNGAPSPGPDGHISLVSGWQGDVAPTPTNQTIDVPIAKQRDGSPVTGPVLARFWDLPAGSNTAVIRLGSLGTAFYPPLTLDTGKARLTYHTSETVTGKIAGTATVGSTDWAFADCRTQPFPGTPDPSRICLRNGFDGARVYELVYTAKDPRVLGIGLAATRDIMTFFRYASADRGGTPNPIANMVRHTIAVGTSQSGNFIKTFIHLGFNEDLAGRTVWEGVFPYIAARQTPINFRFATPGGAGTLYEPGSEPILWWDRYTDRTRGRTAGSLLDRCTATHTCPKVIEAFGSTEFWDLRMSPGLVGTDAVKDIPLPENVRRYYMPGTTHGGGRGGFELLQGNGGQCVLPQNPNPMSDTMRALTAALIEWVGNGTPPPPSRYPTLAARMLVPATRTATGFPAIPAAQFPEGLINAVLDYDFGPAFRYNDMSGVITQQPPAIKQALPTLVPRVNEDGNEVAGVASVLHQAPLGTYLGWNMQASGFFKGQLCGFTGGYIPFAVTKAERLDANDPRLSLEERYGSQEGYVCIVRRAAEALVKDRFLSREDADRTIEAAARARILPGGAEATAENRARGEELCK